MDKPLNLEVHHRVTGDDRRHSTNTDKDSGSCTEGWSARAALLNKKQCNCITVSLVLYPFSLGVFYEYACTDVCMMYFMEGWFNFCEQFMNCSTREGEGGFFPKKFLQRPYVNGQHRISHVVLYTMGSSRCFNYFCCPSFHPSLIVSSGHSDILPNGQLSLSTKNSLLSGNEDADDESEEDMKDEDGKLHGHIASKLEPSMMILCWWIVWFPWRLWWCHTGWFYCEEIVCHVTYSTCVESKCGNWR